jgi:hypothetical protein
LSLCSHGVSLDTRGALGSHDLQNLHALIAGHFNADFRVA